MPGDLALDFALSSGAKDGEHGRRAGLLAPGSSRVLRNLPTSNCWQWFRLLLTNTSGNHRKKRWPDTVARPHRFCTDFPILLVTSHPATVHIIQLAKDSIVVLAGSVKRSES